MKYFTDIFNEVFTWCHQTIAAPTLLTAQFIAPNVELEWVDNATNDECWMIWRSTDGTNFTLIETVNVENLEDYTDTTAVAGVLYYYKVQACNLDGDTSDFSNTVQVTNTLTPIKFGVLYNHYAASDPRNICSAGWHIPLSTDRNTLVSFLGGGLIAGGKLKETGLTYWSAPNTGATNEVSFNARGSGFRSGLGVGGFSGVLTWGFWWCSDLYDVNNGYSFQMYNSLAWITASWNQPLSGGFALRPVKDSTTLNHGETGTYVGNDLKVYRTIAIGAPGSVQEWVADNIAETKYQNGDDIPYEADPTNWMALVTGARCLYNNSWAYL